MKPIISLLELLELSGNIPLRVQEDFERLDATGAIAADQLAVPEISALSARSSELINWSDFTLSIICDDNESIDLDSTNLNYSHFISAIQSEVDYKFTSCIVKITCFKDRSKSTVSIFNLEKFVNYINSLNYKQQIIILWNKFYINKYLAFELLEDSYAEFSTGSIFFLHGRKSPALEEIASLQTLRKDRFNAIRNVCHFESAADCQFIPDDFYLTRGDNCPPSLKSLLERMCGLVSIISLFDITRLVDEGVEFKLNGYKSISGVVPGDRLHQGSISEYYRIYDWVYGGGNLSDKIGLTRNLVSIHLASQETLELKGNPFDSVRSAFDLYLKQNIKQYIELRGKISDQLVDQTNKATKIAEEFAGSYKKSVLAVVSFFASVIIAKVFTTKELHGTFTKEASIIAFAFLSISALYFLLSYKEFSKEKERFVKNYQNLKSRFTDLLVQEDIDRILDGNKIHVDDLSYMDSKIKRFSILWFSTLAIMLFAVLILSDTYNFNWIRSGLQSVVAHISTTRN